MRVAVCSDAAKQDGDVDQNAEDDKDGHRRADFKVFRATSRSSRRHKSEAGSETMRTRKMEKKEKYGRENGSSNMRVPIIGRDRKS